MQYLMTDIKKYGGFKMYYVFMDTETGGLSSDIHSLLQVAMLITDDNFNLIEELHLYTKPDDGNYVIKKEAVSVNGFNFSEHENVAVTYSQMIEIIKSFLGKYNDQPVQLVGWNIQFDVDFIKKHIDLNAFFGHRYIDVMSLYLFLKIIDKDIPAGNSLVSASKYFQYNTKDSHNALIDASLTKMVFYDILKLLRGQ